MLQHRMRRVCGLVGGVASAICVLTARAQGSDIVTFPLMTNFVPTDVSGDGRVIVGSRRSGGVDVTFITTRETANGYSADELRPPAPYTSILGEAVSADGTTIVGQLSGGGAPTTAFRWRAQTGFELLAGHGGLRSQFAYDVSHDGSVVVGEALASGGSVATLWNAAGVPTNLGRLPGDATSVALGVSADGAIVVGKSGAGKAFRWSATSGMVNISPALPELELEFPSFEAVRVSSNGRVIVGNVLGTGLTGGSYAWHIKDGVAQPMPPSSGDRRGSVRGLTSTGHTWVGTQATTGGITWQWDPVEFQPAWSAYRDTWNGPTRLYANANAISDDESTLVGLATSSGLGYIHLRNVTRRIDVSGDGLLDIFWRNTTTGQNGSWSMLMGSTPTVQSWWSFPTVPAGQGWAMQAMLDLTGDGNPDCVWRNTTTGLTGFWTMLGGTVQRWTTMPFAPVDPAWSIIGSGDANQDRIDDLFWYNATTGACGWWLMQPMGRIGAWLSFPTVPPSTGWRPVLIGHLNNFPEPEVFWRNATTGENGVWLVEKSGPSVLGWLSLPTVATPGWSPRMVRDVSGDGLGDVLWHSTTTGQCGLWIMDPSGEISSWWSLPTVPAGWIPGP